MRETYSQHHTQRAKTKNFPTTIRNKTKLSTFTTSIQHTIGSPSHSNQTSEGNKRHPNWKRGNKLSLFADDVNVYIQNPMDSTKKTAQSNKWIWQNSGIQSQYSEIKDIFVYQQWSIRNRNQGEKIPFAIATRKIKYLGINLTKEVRDLNSQNYTTLKKEIKEDTNKWKHILCPSILMMLILLE